LFAALAIVQSIYRDLSPIIPVIAFRYYLFFIPLAFIIGDVFDADDLKRWTKWNLYMLVPLAALSLLQFYSPTDSFINSGVGQVDISQDKDYIFVVAEGVVRPYGTFSFTTGQALYSIFGVAVALIALERRRQLNLSTLVLLIGVISAFAMGAVNGTRSFFIGATIVIAAYFVSSATTATRFRTRIFIVAAAVLTFAFIFIVILPQAFDTMAERQATATGDEGSIFLRMISNFTEFTTVLDSTPALGYGVGAGTNVGVYLTTGERGFLIGEVEWTRLIGEMGQVVGLAVILLRVCFCVWLGLLAFNACRRKNDPSPVIWFGFVGPLLLIGQITSQNTENGFAWFGVGLVLASAKLPAKRMFPTENTANRSGRIGSEIVAARTLSPTTVRDKAARVPF
jgi:hypothetical protein